MNWPYNCLDPHFLVMPLTSGLYPFLAHEVNVIVNPKDTRITMCVRELKGGGEFLCLLKELEPKHIVIAILFSKRDIQGYKVPFKYTRKCLFPVLVPLHSS
jgi:hypothetical protein